eukprot:Tbor_TRINITY_DN8819_c0_g1::TRINITY_DN8819_c0_g1_i1::g.17729::m.17729
MGARERLELLKAFRANRLRAKGSIMSSTPQSSVITARETCDHQNDHVYADAEQWEANRGKGNTVTSSVLEHKSPPIYKQKMLAAIYQEMPHDQNEEILQEKEVHRKEKKELARVLREQIEMRRKEKREAREAFLSQRPFIDSSYRDYKEELLQTKMKKLKEMLKLGEEREKQASERKTTKLRETARNQEADKKIVLEMIRAEEISRQAALEAKRAILDAKNDLLVVNIAQKKQREAQRRKEREEEIRMTTMMNEIEDRRKLLRAGDEARYRQMIRDNQINAMKESGAKYFLNSGVATH